VICMRKCVYCKKDKASKEFNKKDKGACKNCTKVMNIMLTADDEDTKYLNSIAELLEDDD